MSYLRIRFVTSNDWVSNCIRGAELGFLFSHVEVLIPSGPHAGTYIGAHVDGGVQARPVGYDKADNPVEMFADVPVTADQEEAAYAFLMAQLGEPYDVAAILDIARSAINPLIDLSPGRWDDAGCWICSELVETMLVDIGVLEKSFPLSQRHVTPAMCAVSLWGVAKFTKPSRPFMPDTVKAA